MKDHQLLRNFVRESFNLTKDDAGSFRYLLMRESTLAGLEPGKATEFSKQALSGLADQLIGKANAPDLCDKTYENDTDLAWAVLIASFLVLGHPGAQSAVRSVGSTLSRRIVPHLSSVIANTSRLSTLGILTDLLSVFFTGLFLKKANEALNQYFDIVTDKNSSREDIAAAHALLLTRLFLIFVSYKLSMVSSNPSVPMQEGLSFVKRIHAIIVNIAKESTPWMKAYMTNFTAGIGSLILFENEDQIAEMILESTLFKDSIQKFKQNVKDQKTKLFIEKAQVDRLNSLITAQEALKNSLGEGRFSAEEMKLLSDYIKNETFKDIEGYNFNNTVFSDPREMSVTSAMCAMRALIERYYEDYIDRKESLGGETS